VNKKIENIRTVTIYFLKRAEEEHFPIGKVRITKLLYLLDVEYFRDNGSIFTGLNWIYYKYGPYTAEIDDMLSQVGIKLEEEAFTSKKSIKKLMVSESFAAYSADTHLENYLHRIWTAWGMESLPRLLDFVYFETEPMFDAKRGEQLDFSKVIKKEIPRKIKWSSEKQKKMHEIGKSIRKKLIKISLPNSPQFPKETTAILRIWDEDEIADLRGLKGKATIDFS